MIPTDREPTHPGEILLEEFLQPLGVTQSHAAERMGIPLNRLNEIIKGKRGVSADTALRLSRVLETSAEFWLNLQTNWDLYHAQKDLAATLETLTVITVPEPVYVPARNVRLNLDLNWLTIPTGIKVVLSSGAPSNRSVKETGEKAQCKEENLVAA